MLERWIAQAGGRPLDGDVYDRPEPTPAPVEPEPDADEPFTIDEV